jgi:metallo-beta-lactamase family protein
MTLGGYSGHADQAQLVAFAHGDARPPRRIVLVHGEKNAKEALARSLRNRYASSGNEILVTIP